VRQEVIESLGGITDTLKPIEQSLRMHEMRPFDVEPNYFEDLQRSRAQLRGDKVRSHMGQTKDEMHQGTTRSEFLKKSINERDFVRQHGKIISASPFRAVLRRKYEVAPALPEEDDERDKKSDNEDDEEEENDQMGDFDRAINDVSEISDKGDIYNTGRPFGSV
jgi:hypothetical protein